MLVTRERLRSVSASGEDGTWWLGKRRALPGNDFSQSRRRRIRAAMCLRG